MPKDFKHLKISGLEPLSGHCGGNTNVIWEEPWQAEQQILDSHSKTGWIGILKGNILVQAWQKMYMQILFNAVIFMQKEHKWFSQLLSGDSANVDPLKGGSSRFAEICVQSSKYKN